jgi:RimJ/RimL family protein N-acetyltransferase
VPPCAGVVAHTGPGAADLAGAAPPTWEPGEWADLVAGRLGPWAAVRRGGRVVALCFTPVAGPEGAEAGVWTDPGHRGRGFAAAATARWATSFPGGRPLFHSTSDANRSSQRVAARLGLPRLGRLWKASRPGRGGEHHRRPWAPG